MIGINQNTIRDFNCENTPSLHYDFLGKLGRRTFPNVLYVRIYRGGRELKLKTRWCGKFLHETHLGKWGIKSIIFNPFQTMNEIMTFDFHFLEICFREA